MPRAEAFFDALHRRICDRVTLGWARTWLAENSNLTPTTRNGWPLLVLTLKKEPPDYASQSVLRLYYQRATKAGPVADLANALEVQP